MLTGAGYKSKTAWRREGKQSAYGTASGCGNDDQAPLVSESLERDINKEPDNVVRHKAGIGGHTVTGKLVSGSITIEAVYRGLESLLVSALGFCHYEDSPETVAAGVYKHSIELAEHLHTESWAAGDGILAGSGYLAGDNKVRRGTLCVDKTVSVWEHASCMINTLAIKGDAKGVKLELDLVPSDQERNTATNPDSAAWSIPDDDWLSILFQDLEVWIGDYSTVTPLSAADAIGIKNFELKLDNNLKIEQDSRSGLLIAEPRRDGKRTVSGSFVIPRYQDNDFLADLDAQAAKMARLKFTGKEIGATGHNYEMVIWLATLKLDTGRAPVTGPNILPAEYTFTAEIPANVPAGFPAKASKELFVELQSNLATNPLK